MRTGRVCAGGGGASRVRRPRRAAPLSPLLFVRREEPVRERRCGRRGTEVGPEENRCPLRARELPQNLRPVPGPYSGPSPAEKAAGRDPPRWLGLRGGMRGWSGPRRGSGAAAGRGAQGCVRPRACGVRGRGCPGWLATAPRRQGRCSESRVTVTPARSRGCPGRTLGLGNPSAFF